MKDSEHKDISDPSYSTADFRVQLAGGRLRWFATLLAVGRSVSAIRNGAESIGEPHEIIVVDDASSDATASIARQQGAQVVRVEHRQIAPLAIPARGRLTATFYFLWMPTH